MHATDCSRCAEFEKQRDELFGQLAELNKLVELQEADLKRYRAEAESNTPNQPERVPKNQLQLAFEEVLASIQDSAERKALEDAVANNEADGGANTSSNDSATEGQSKNKKKGSGGRRKLELSKLDVERVVIDPDEVVACNGEGFELLGTETSNRVAFRPAAYFRLQIERRKWARRVPQTEEAPEGTEVLVGLPPPSVWPYYMADPSAIGRGIVAKYDDLLPKHRQQKISRRHGFEVPRSTLCGWMKEAHANLHHIVDAMFNEAKTTAYCIGTDATSAPVRGPGRGSLEPWQVFVFIADQDHVVFRYAPSGTSAAVSTMLEGYRGCVVADAAPIFDILYRDGEMIEVACWSHMRRYFWKALGSHAGVAMQFLALISKLFLIARWSQSIPLPERTEARAARARPILAAIDALVKAHDHEEDARSPLAKAIGYYKNQRAALHRFLEDGRLPLHNNASESSLRNLVLGRHNWMFFENETGLKWYVTFRSLLASCHLHDLNPQEYLQDVLRLVPHWPKSRVIELAPKHWRATKEGLSEEQRAIITPPWIHDWPTVSMNSPRTAKAA